MSDPRNTPDRTLVRENTPAQIISPIVDLCRHPDGARDRQLIFGDAVTLLNRGDKWCYIQSGKDHYCGYVKSDSLGIPTTPTHKVTAPATHVYERADFKSPDLHCLNFGSQLSITATTGNFAKTTLGFVPMTHLTNVSTHAPDPATIASLFLGTPYLWGGNSRWGIDCSGLIQAALLACGITCPGDSDQQQVLGETATAPYKRNDLLFWKGHVALVADTQTLIHANAFSMSVTYEPIIAAIARINDQGDGPVTAHRRI